MYTSKAFRVILAALALTTGHLPGTEPEEAAFDRFGGFTGIQREATGFFRVEEIHGRWFFITPEGHPFVALGANHLRLALESMKPHHGGDEAAASEAIALKLREMGLNAGDAYTLTRPKPDARLPWIPELQYPGNEKFKIDMFDPQWQREMREHIIQQCRAFSNDPFVLGVGLIDLPHYGDLRLHFFRSLLPESAPGRKRYEEAKKAGMDDDDFLALAAGTLHALARDAVREGAPNHLFFGEKFQLDDAPDAVLKAVGKHVDVFCTQALVVSASQRRDWRSQRQADASHAQAPVQSPQPPPEWQVFPAEDFDHEHALTGKPILIVDWSSAFSLGEEFESPVGAIRADTQAAADQTRWLEEAFARPYVVGVFRCMLAGFHPDDRRFEGRATRSILREDGTPFFPTMTRSATDTNRSVLRRIYDFPDMPNREPSQP